MQPTMKLVSYEEFGRLRLRPFCPKDDFCGESIVEDSHCDVIAERILVKNCSAIDFVRSSKRPDELALVGIYPESWESIGWASNVARSILAAIGLGLEQGLSLEQTISRFGMPAHWQSKDRRHAIFHTGGDSPYAVHCDYNPADNDKLNRVIVHRLDIEVPDGE